jgi:biopolymer transport protein ExbD
MKLRRQNRLLAEPPSSATGDIAFNLIVFFLVCASVQPDSGRPQTLPSSETIKDQQQKSKNIEVQLTRTAVLLNGDPVRRSEFGDRIRSLLSRKTSAEDKIVVVKSKPETPYHHWIGVTSTIEDSGGIVTLQIEEEREVQLPN